jgi:ribosomal protein S18 acetylase RimI-like enzyme
VHGSDDTTDVRPDTVVTTRTHTDQAALALIGDLASIYGEVYQEPPYLEGSHEVAAFMAEWPTRVAVPGFRLVTADDCGAVVGFAYGHGLSAGVGWWSGATTALPAELVTEHPGRTFAIIELAVRRDYRRRGLARRLHRALLADRTEARVTLLAHPQATAAQHAYARWGYRRVGQIRPAAGASVCDALMRDLPL